MNFEVMTEERFDYAGGHRGRDQSELLGLLEDIGAPRGAWVEARRWPDGRWVIAVHAVGMHKHFDSDGVVSLSEDCAEESDEVLAVWL